MANNLEDMSLDSQLIVYNSSVDLTDKTPQKLTRGTTIQALGDLLLADVNEVISGGATGQVLTKVDGADYNYSWQDAGGLELTYGTWVPNGIPSSSATRQGAYARMGNLVHCIGKVVLSQSFTITTNALGADADVYNLPFPMEIFNTEGEFNRTLNFNQIWSFNPFQVTTVFGGVRGGNIGQWAVINSAGSLVKTGIAAVGFSNNNVLGAYENIILLAEGADYTMVSGDTLMFEFKYIAE